MSNKKASTRESTIASISNLLEEKQPSPDTVRKITFMAPNVQYHENHWREFCIHCQQQQKNERNYKYIQNLSQCLI